MQQKKTIKEKGRCEKKNNQKNKQRMDRLQTGILAVKYRMRNGALQYV